MPRRTRSKKSGPDDAKGAHPSSPRPARLEPAVDAGTHPEGGETAVDYASLTKYESEQVRQIAAWKGEAPGTRFRLFEKAERSMARFAERFIPARVVKETIEKVYEEAELTATRDDIERQAGVHDLGELRHRPLEECDRLAHGVGVWAQGLAVAGGAATGAGGFLTSALDVPLLLTLALRTILRTGHCYGYPLNRPRDRRMVLGTLMVAATDDPEKKQELLTNLREVEDWMVEEAEQQLVEDEAMDLLLQVEIFDDVPGLGAITAGLENFAFVHQAAEASKRVFQERWLRDNGKVAAIDPAPAEHIAGARHWGDGLVPHLTYTFSYYLGYGVMMPVWVVAHALAPSDNALLRGLREGASAAIEGADHSIDQLRSLIGPSQGLPVNSTALKPA